jgi:hypothetical protein
MRHDESAIALSIFSHIDPLRLNRRKFKSGFRFVSFNETTLARIIARNPTGLDCSFVRFPLALTPSNAQNLRFSMPAPTRGILMISPGVRDTVAASRFNSVAVYKDGPYFK